MIFRILRIFLLLLSFASLFLLAFAVVEGPAVSDFVLLLQSPAVAAVPCCCWRPLCSRVLLLPFVGVLALHNIPSFHLLVTSHASAPFVVGFSLLLLLSSCSSLLPLLLILSHAFAGVVFVDVASAVAVATYLLLLVCLLLLASLLFLAFLAATTLASAGVPDPCDLALLLMSLLLLSF